ncbi:bifunctional 2-keto-4-hydroxyglutarate aldolase/2-keto-3-deoxy-6-phosphogluconate aldolase [Halobacillus massiliensis]|uniref:bifunctional 2-keto-4-hydroxyglutarate aldolase/2-keto-3-deoxy-6-phosphogluconate aldolase n=1 Tax=Halobacillus massiliensis TaxID=1926286 RepID=UPI0009E4F914|nr:bifunctional 2-keto-4-hydroxyglutarate aldolase/2-keto-3-deoxy-6-phosphogluconate aldolase [Halobacillus massiliensis]
MNKIHTLQKLEKEKLVAVIRGETSEEAQKISEGAYAGGIKIMEITYTVPNASQLIEKLSADQERDWVIGAGTVLDEVTARMAILAGAEFIVAPNFNLDVAKLCNRYQIPYIPGCYTVNEVVQAMEAGADIIKIFPGNTISPAGIKAIKGPLPQANIMPSGGVSADNLNEWLEKGAVAVSIGGSLYKENFEDIKAAAEELVQKL